MFPFSAAGASWMRTASTTRTRRAGSLPRRDQHILRAAVGDEAEVSPSARMDVAAFLYVPYRTLPYHTLFSEPLERSGQPPKIKATQDKKLAISPASARGCSNKVSSNEASFVNPPTMCEYKEVCFVGPMGLHK